MCDSRCTTATSPRSYCRCDCRGANHGAGSYSRYPASYRGYRSSPRFVTPTFSDQEPPESEPQTVSEYFRSTGKSALTGALIYGLSAAFPPVGAVAIPAYTAYGYIRLSYTLYMAF